MAGSAPASGGSGDPIALVGGRPGLTLVGRTIFPDEALPTPARLDAAQVDLAILFAGDGTINAAIGALDGWRGRILILPGGTMNMLARELHGDADPATILARLEEGPLSALPTIALPYVAVGRHRAYVALIAGPPSTWARAREAVRKGRLAAAWRAARLAWARSFAGGVRLKGTRRERHHRAVVAIPGPPGIGQGMEVAAIDVDGWLQAARLGIDWLGSAWLGGDWRASPHVRLSRQDEAVLKGGRAIHLLLDGEMVKLPAPVRLSSGMTRPMFIRTAPAPGAATATEVEASPSVRKIAEPVA